MTADGTATNPIMLADLTSPELGVLVGTIEMIVIPVGAHEQHGPALPLATDTLIAQVMCTLTGALLRPRVAIAPTIPWGVSRAHLRYPGTISLRESTLIELVLDVITSMQKHGFERFLIVNTHGGNNAALRVAAERAHFEYGVPMAASIDAYALIAKASAEVLGEEAKGHGGGDEAAAVFVARPDLVRTELLANPTMNEPLVKVMGLLRAATGALPAMQDRVSENGASGDSTVATREAGSAIVSHAATELQGIIEELLALDITDIPFIPEHEG